MIFEYRRLLSEVWYANQMFWVLNLLVQSLSLAFLWTDLSDVSYMLVVASVNIVANFALLILMLKTKKRTLQNRRPEFNLMGESPARLRRPLVDDQSSSNNGPYFNVNFKRKVVNNSEYTLQITTSDENYKSYKITKQFQDFKRLQTIVEQVAIKQNALFSNSAKIEADHYMMTRQQFTVKAPVLDDVKKSFVGQDDTRNLMALFESLEKFTDEITSNKLFWVSDVLNFFNIPQDSPLSHQLIAEHEKHLKQVFSLDDRKSVTRPERRKSYAGKDEMDDEIEEEK